MNPVEKIILAGSLLAFLIGALLFVTGCNGHQPTGKDLWLAVAQQQQEIAR